MSIINCRDSNRLRQRPNSVEDVGFKNATFNEIDHSVVYEHDHRGTIAATEEGIGERCINETSLITGAVIFLIAQVTTTYRIIGKTVAGFGYSVISVGYLRANFHFTC